MAGERGVVLPGIGLETGQVVQGDGDGRVVRAALLAPCFDDGLRFDHRFGAPTPAQAQAWPSKPLQMVVTRAGAAPTVTLYPVPDSAATYTLVYWRLRRIQDAGASADVTHDIPFRFLPALTSGLAYYLSFKITGAGERIHKAVPLTTRTQMELGGKNPMVVCADADLDAAVAAQLTALLGHEPLRDDDGDLALRVGTSMVFLRPSRDAQEVLVFAPLVHDIEGRSRAMEVISDLNTEARFVRFMLIRDRVFVSLSIFAQPFVPAHLHQALRAVSVVSDEIDEHLASKLRGRTTFAAPRRFGSMTTSVDRPVTSSTCLATVLPSSTFSNWVLPANSVMMGRVSGSQLAKIAPALMAWSILTVRMAP